MRLQEDRNKVYFVYDGECPICNMSARFFKIKKSAGELVVFDARTQKDHPVMKEIEKRKMSIDEGMVIKMNDNFYHGSDALHIMALIGSNNGVFNKINCFLFQNKTTAKVFYPLFKTVRNLLLKIRGIEKIDAGKIH